MDIRPAVASDLLLIEEIDCVIESNEYLHIDRSGEGMSLSFRLEKRPLRETLILPNAFDDETGFALKQIASGMDEGVCRVAQHEDRIVAMMLAQSNPVLGTMKVLDIRVDYEFRRQGLATVLLYQLIEEAKQADLRAVSILTKTNNAPAAAMLEKLGFELSGLDTRRHSNHDLVKESATLIWYYAIS